MYMCTIVCAKLAILFSFPNKITQYFIFFFVFHCEQTDH